MAKNEKQDKDVSEVAPKKGQGGAVKWIIAGMLVLLIVGASVVVSIYFLTKGTIGGKKEQPTVVISWPMTEPLSFIVNLTGDGGERYLRAKMVFEVDNPASLHELDVAESRIRDAVIDLLSSKAPADLADPSGKQRLREEIIVRVNGTTPTGRISRVNFIEFAIGQ
jgi:flagellar FliL protein